jgi:hypothetical protein
MSDIKDEAQRLVDEAGIKMIPHIRRNPLILGGMFVELTRSLFSFEENLYPPAITWSATNEKDHLFIDPAYKWDPENIDRTPAIYVDIGDMQISSEPVKGIGSHGTHFDLKEGVDYREDVVGTSVVWAHVGDTRAECLLYQGITYDLIAGLSFAIKRDFCLEKFDVRAILKPKLQSDQPRTYVAEVQATMQFREPYALKREAPKLKQITVEAAARTVDQTFNLVK